MSIESSSPPPFDVKNPGSSGNGAIDRVLSGETDESPFGSNLVTPTDEDIYPVGIQARLDAAQTALSYFASEKLVKEAQIEQKYLSTSTNTSAVAEADGLTTNQSHNVSEEDPGNSQIGTLGSFDTITSCYSSESFQEIAGPSIYNLPNDHINIPEPSESHQEMTKPLLDSDSCSIIKQPDLGMAFWMKEFESTVENITFKAILSISLRLVCFLPWCAAVGAALILSPERLELVAFSPGYIESLSGIHRYAYWAEYGFHHIMIFLGALATFTWSYPSLGFVVMGGLLAQFCLVWHRFLLDHNIPLGDDDQQSVFLLATTSWLNDTPISIRKVGESYYFAEPAADDSTDRDDEPVSESGTLAK